MISAWNRSCQCPSGSAVCNCKYSFIFCFFFGYGMCGSFINRLLMSVFYKILYLFFRCNIYCFFIFLHVFLTKYRFCMGGIFSLTMLLRYADFKQGKAVVIVIFLLMIVGFGALSFKCFKSVFRKKDVQKNEKAVNITAVFVQKKRAWVFKLSFFKFPIIPY